MVPIKINPDPAVSARNSLVQVLKKRANEVAPKPQAEVEGSPRYAKGLYRPPGFEDSSFSGVAWLSRYGSIWESRWGGRWS